jgi:4a-hydroxytetrahydrobiopterin dehydratase
MNQAPPDGWALQENALTRTVQRKDFVEALGYLAAVGRLAEAANHHPDVDLRYNKLHLSLSTHSAGHQVTEKDLLLAGKINALDEDEIESLTHDQRRLLAS